MYYKIYKRLKNNNLSIVVILVTIINIIVYGKMLLGNSIYMYKDIGSDTINIYYPSLYYLTEMIKNGQLDLFIPNIALGNSIFSIITQILDPFFIILLILPIRYLQYAILISSILKIYTISIFAFFIFKRYFKNNVTQIICPLIYTFSSYIILWGQHHTFLKSIMLFTIFMYLLDKFLFDKKNNKMIFILLLSFFACSSIYFFYATGIFSIIYITFWLFNKRLTLKNYFIKLFQLLIMTIFGCCLSMFLILPWIESFFISNRSESQSLTLARLFNIDLTHILATLGRFYSTNLLGNALKYNGELNFYEAPIIFASSLVFISIIGLIIKSKCRKKVISILLVSIIAITLPITNMIFNFTINSYRWTFIITYISIFAVGKFLDDIDQTIERKNIYIWGIVSIIFLIITIILIEDFVGKINVYSLIGVFTFLILFYLILVLLNKYRNLILKISLILIVVVELTINSYSLVNNRGVISKEEWISNYYSYETKKTVDYIYSIDDSFYRIQMNNRDVSLNDALVYGNLGLNSYNSLNQISYESYIETMNLETSVIIPKSGGGNCFEIDDMDYIINTLLGVKYVISDEDDYLPAYYKKINEIDGKKVYENTLYLPFGYTYKNNYTKEDFFNADGINKYDYLLNGFFYTDDVENENSKFTKYEQDFGKFTGNEILGEGNIDQVEVINLSASIDNNLVRIKPETNDPIIIYEFQEVTKNPLILTIYFNSTIYKEVEIYYSKTKEFSQENSQYKLLRTNNNQVSFVLPTGIKYLRIDPSKNKKEFYIDNISIYSLENLNYNEKIKDLSENSLENIMYKDSNLIGTINNTNNEDVMLVIPFSFNSGIKAYIDGEERKISNVNGGLIGLQIESGEHDIRFDFKPMTWSIGKNISIFSIIIYIIIFIYNKIRKTLRIL